VDDHERGGREENAEAGGGEGKKGQVEKQHQILCKGEGRGKKRTTIFRYAYRLQSQREKSKDLPKGKRKKIINIFHSKKEKKKRDKGVILNIESI